MKKIPTVLMVVLAYSLQFSLTAYFWFYTNMPKGLGFLIPNAIGGLLMHIVSWSAIPRIREPLEERDALFPAFRRLDAHLWRHSLFIPGALTVSMARALMSGWALFSLVIWLKIVMLGYKWSKEPL